jgi:hypothetical protein
MILLYTLVVLLLGAARLALVRRVARLERKYSGAALAAEELLREPLRKGGNSAKPDACREAKRQYQLGLLVQKRDRLESKYGAWQELAEKFGRLGAAVQGWKGKTLPYAVGALDVALLLFVIDYVGAGEYVRADRLVELAATVFTE